MKVLGIDPGTAILGWGVVVREAGKVTALDYGAIETPAGEAMETRLLTLYQELCAVIARLRPNCAAVEKLFFGQNTKSALSVGQARGVVLLALAQANLPVWELTPAEVKQAVTGWGRADKRQIQAMVTRLLQLDEVPHPDDTADALAIALTAAEQMRFKEALR